MCGKKKEWERGRERELLRPRGIGRERVREEREKMQTKERKSVKERVKEEETDRVCV